MSLSLCEHASNQAINPRRHDDPVKRDKHVFQVRNRITRAFTDRRALERGGGKKYVFVLLEDIRLSARSG